MVDIKKLENYVDTIGIYPDLSKVMETDNFAIASNGIMAAVIYKTDDYVTNHKFANSMDIVVKAIELAKEKNTEFVIVNRKKMLNILKVLKKDLKEKNKKRMMYDHEIMVGFEVKNYFLNIYLFSKLAEYKSDVEKIEIDQQGEDANFVFTYKFLVKYLEFFPRIDWITINYSDYKNPVYTKVDNREILLMPRKVNEREILFKKE